MYGYYYYWVIKIFLEVSSYYGNLSSLIMFFWSLMGMWGGDNYGNICVVYMVKMIEVVVWLEFFERGLFLYI